MKRGIENRRQRRTRPRDAQPLAPFALAEDLGVGGQHQRLASGRRRAVDQGLPDFIRAEHVELPPMAQSLDFGDVFHPVVRHCPLDERHSAFRGSASQGQVRMALEQAVEPGGRDQQRHFRFAPENLVLRSAVGFVDQHVRHETPIRIGGALAFQRRFLARATLEIFEHDPRQAPMRPRAQVLDRSHAREVVSSVISPARRTAELGCIHRVKNGRARQGVPPMRNFARTRELFNRR